MNSTDSLTLGFVALVSLVFIVAGPRMKFFIGTYAAIVSIFLYAAWSWNGWRSTAELIFASGGLVLFSFGLLAVRVMLTRSVSLKLIACYWKDERIEAATEGIAGRLEDMRRYRLVRVIGQKYELSPFGKFISSIVAFSYFWLKLK